MPNFFSTLVASEFGDQDPHQSSFWIDPKPVVFDSSNDAEKTLARLVFQVCREPGNLLGHLRRVYFCYQQQLAEPLYAALLDLLLVLRGRGAVFSHRVLEGSRSQLSRQQFLVLKQGVKGDLDKLGNRYSVFSSGTVGRKVLLEQGQQAPGQVDVLVLANDFIEYSQLDQAMAVLEQGMRDQPLRQDIQQALLELYKSTGEQARFQSTYAKCSEAGMSLAEDWLEMAAYFAGRSA